MEEAGDEGRLQVRCCLLLCCLPQPHPRQSLPAVVPLLCGWCRVGVQEGECDTVRLESVDALRVGQQQQDCDGGVWRVLNSNPSCASAVAPSAERGVADGDGTAEQHCGRG